jgi:hypothetical protein
VTYDDTAGLNQLYRRRKLPTAELLERMFGESPALTGAAHGA